MALLLTSSPRRTLRLYWPRGKYLLLAVGLALTLNPLVNELRPIVEKLFPVSPVIKAALDQMMVEVPNVATALLLFALIPAVCEEVAFRGFILTGLEYGHKPRSAILLSALLFGFLHVLLSLYQQLFNATLLGVVLGLLAVRSRSLLPGIVFHLINNGLAVLLGHWVGSPSGRRVASLLYRNPGQGLYHWWLVALGGLASVALLTYLARSDASKNPRNDAEPAEPLDAMASLT
jgi:sodium transport system permease protein